MAAATVSEITPFGAETDLDLSDPSNGEAFKQLFQQYELLVFRNQSLDTEQQIRVMENIGPVPLDWRLVGVVSNTRQDGMLGNAEIEWHSDFAFVEKPNVCTTLHAIEVGHEITSTMFASAITALNKLPPELRARIEGLEVLNLYPSSTYGLRQRLEDYPAHLPRAAHPIIKPDPYSGKLALFLNETNTDSIIGLPPEESEALLAELKGYIYGADNVYEHKWRNGDFVVWANVSVQHRRGPLKSDRERSLRRVCVVDGPLEMYTNQASDRRPAGALYENGVMLQPAA
jgi:taurine dioxygenase